MNRKEKILGFISDENYIAMKANEIAAVLNVSKADKLEFKQLLDELEAEGMLYRTSSGKYTTPDKNNIITGIFYAKPQGYGFVYDDNDTKYFVPPNHSNNAFNGDKIQAKIIKRSNDSEKCSECKVIKILSHGINKIVGTFKKEKNFGFLIPDDRAFGSDIYISKKNSKGLKNGQKIVAEITKWPKQNQNPEGVPCEVLGYIDDDMVDIKSLIRQHGIDEEFPEKVLLSAKAFGDSIFEDETQNRLDLRSEMCFTIDGNDSKDFDDAVGIKMSKGEYILSVHIADVSYYVSENSALDIEARRRGTSIYLPGYVVPMLPAQLSNGICSLNPNCDRLTLSVIMRFDKSGNMLKHSINETVINSKYRLTYDKVTAILDGDTELTKEYRDIADDLGAMRKLADILKKKRINKGSIDFNFPESKIILDEHGKVKDVVKFQAGISNNIIEEFMLAANTCVAEEMFWCELPFIYRIHENPSPDKINTFKKFVLNLGYKFNINLDNPMPGTFAKLYDSIKGSDKELMISKMMLRSLMKAKYSDECIGHFGLSFKYYCHFTSPIRRYPDLVIHRIIKEHIRAPISNKRQRYLKIFVHDAAKSSSNAELKAMEIEREADDMKKAEYMSGKIGQVFPAVITSITSFGIFAEIENGIEGLISMSDLYDDYYEFDEKTLTLKGKHDGFEYRIGDLITISVKKADPTLRQIDFYIESSGVNE